MASDRVDNRALLLLRCASPVVTDRETRTHRRGRSKRSYGHCRRRTDISQAEPPSGSGQNIGDDVWSWDTWPTDAIDVDGRCLRDRRAALHALAQPLHRRRHRRPASSPPLRVIAGGRSGLPSRTGAAGRYNTVVSLMAIVAG
jgi:hypothetical protein